MSLGGLIGGIAGLIGGAVQGSPKAPPPPSPPPVFAPTQAEGEATSAAALELRRRRGRTATILAGGMPGGLGAPVPAGPAKTLLGE